MHDALTVGVPVMVIILGILINRHDVRDLRAEMSRRFDVVDSELRYFHGQTGKLEGRLDALSQRGQ